MPSNLAALSSDLKAIQTKRVAKSTSNFTACCLSHCPQNKLETAAKILYLLTLESSPVTRATKTHPKNSSQTALKSHSLLSYPSSLVYYSVTSLLSSTARATRKQAKTSNQFTLRLYVLFSHPSRTIYRVLRPGSYNIIISNVKNNIDKLKLAVKLPLNYTSCCLIRNPLAIIYLDRHHHYSNRRTIKTTNASKTKSTQNTVLELAAKLPSNYTLHCCMHNFLFIM